jgi:hypothetical protein
MTTSLNTPAVALPPIRVKLEAVAVKMNGNDFIADNPGMTLFHCHQQLHMDFGFMALFDYKGPT